MTALRKDGNLGDGAGDSSGDSSGRETEPGSGGLILVDSHAHLDHVASRLGGDFVANMLDTIREAGSFIVDAGTEPGDLGPRRERYAGSGAVKFTAGLWPGRRSLGDPRAAIEALESDLERFPCAAVGECGLDYHHMEAAPGVQRELFGMQAEIAARKQLPLVVHSRDAAVDTMEIVASYSGRIPVIIHCFSYDAGTAAKFLDLGCHISFAGNITYRNANALREALVLVPDDRLLLETDSPYMRPEPRRGSPSSSLDLWLTAMVAARLRGTDPEALADITGRNARRLFFRKAGG